MEFTTEAQVRIPGSSITTSSSKAKHSFTKWQNSFSQKCEVISKEGQAMMVWHPSKMLSIREVRMSLKQLPSASFLMGLGRKSTLLLTFLMRRRVNSSKFSDKSSERRCLSSSSSLYLWISSSSSQRVWRPNSISQKLVSAKAFLIDWVSSQLHWISTFISFFSSAKQVLCSRDHRCRLWQRFNNLAWSSLLIRVHQLQKLALLVLRLRKISRRSPSSMMSMFMPSLALIPSPKCTSSYFRSFLLRAFSSSSDQSLISVTMWWINLGTMYECKASLFSSNSPSKISNSFFSQCWRVMRICFTLTLSMVLLISSTMCLRMGWAAYSFSRGEQRLNSVGMFSMDFRSKCCEIVWDKLTNSQLFSRRRMKFRMASHLLCFRLRGQALSDRLFIEYLSLVRRDRLKFPSVLSFQF